MEVILLERVQKLGQMGDVVRVKDGYARNFLLPAGKALRANEANRARFESQRVELEARNLELKTEADAVGQKLSGAAFIAIRQAGLTGQLYGSVSPRDIAGLITDGGFSVSRNQVRLDHPIKTIGMHDVSITLHPEVEVGVTINVARTDDEAARQAAGEDMTVESFDDDDDMDLEDAEAEAEDSDDEGNTDDDGTNEDGASEDGASEDEASEEEA